MENKISDKKLLFAVWTCKNKFYGIYQMWDTPIRKLFKNIITFDPQEEIYNYGKKEMNKKFLEIIENEKPDIIFIQMVYDEFYAETLMKIKEISPKTKVVNFNGDDDVMFYSQSLVFFPAIDYFFIAQPEYLEKYEKYGRKAFLMLGVDSKKFKPMNLEKKYEVTFIGTAKADRYDYVKFLLDKGIRVKVFGGGWDKYEDLKNICGGRVNEEDFVKIINQSKINLVFSKNSEGETHVLDRLPEIDMCKSFALVEDSLGYHVLFKEGESIATFKDKEELFNKIIYYLKNDKKREIIAKNAYEICLKDFKIMNLFEKAFNFIIKDKPIFRKDEDKKIIAFVDRDFNLKDEAIIDKMKNFDYVSFKTDNSKFLPFKDFLQINLLEKTKKDMSCCDYYFHSNFIGDYASFYTRAAYHNLTEEDLKKNLDLSQFVVRKKYFLKNLERFRKLFLKKSDNLFDKEDIAFVSMPLVQIKNKRIYDYEKMKKCCFFNFDIPFINILKNKRTLLKSDIYKILIYGIFYEPFILKRLMNRFGTKYKIN